MAAFRGITLNNWRQFAEVSIDVHPRLTVLTGANGAGKSTILNIFSQHFGWSRPFLSTPKRRKDGSFGYDLGYQVSQSPWVDEEDDGDYFDGDDAAQQMLFDVSEIPLAPPPEGGFVQIGTVVYDNGGVSDIGYAEQQTTSYGLNIPNQQSVLGVHVSSHRTLSAYQAVQTISMQAMTISHAYNLYFSELNTRASGGNSQFSSIYRMKEALIAMAAFGEGNSHLEANKALLDAYHGFIAILRKVLPRDLGFQRLVVRLPDIVVKTRSGEFIIDSSSGGLTAIIEIAWQIYLYSLSHDDFVVTIDEPENHLHPSMQRTILANLVDAFPTAQFIVATHSPFIVSAVENSSVYALKYVGTAGPSGFPNRGARRVVSVHLDQSTRGGSASEILREVLGVSVTMPPWAQAKLDQIVERYEHIDITSATLSGLRSELVAAGFADFLPDALARLVTRP